MSLAGSYLTKRFEPCCESDWTYLDKHHDDAHILTEYKGILWMHIKIPLDERTQLGEQTGFEEDPLSAKVCFLNRHSVLGQ